MVHFIKYSTVPFSHVGLKMGRSIAKPGTRTTTAWLIVKCGIIYCYHIAYFFRLPSKVTCLFSSEWRYLLSARSSLIMVFLFSSSLLYCSRSNWAKVRSSSPEEQVQSLISPLRTTVQHSGIKTFPTSLSYM